MSSDLVKRLRAGDTLDIGEAADRIEALEHEVADAELRGERAYEYGKKRQAELIAALDAAEARAERLRVALEVMADITSGDARHFALEAIRAAAGGGE
jgi:hypothetical protein